MEISNAEGMRVREYLDGTGMVFAVAWSGPAMPDLKQLFGQYFDEYSTALQNLKTSGARRPNRVISASLIAELSGHLRAYSGRAYLPARVPLQINVGELR